MVTEDVLRKKFEHLRVAGGPILVEFYLVELCAQWYVFARNGHTQIEGTSVNTLTHFLDEHKTPTQSKISNHTDGDGGSRQQALIHTFEFFPNSVLWRKLYSFTIMSTRQTANQPGMSSLSQLANLNKKELLLLSEEFEDDDFDEEDDDRLDKTTGTLGDWGMPVQSRVEEVTKPQPQQPQDEERDEIQEVKRIAQGETRVVRIWRVVVAVILITAGALVSYGTYYYLDQQLDDETVNKVR